MELPDPTIENPESKFFVVVVATAFVGFFVLRSSLNQLIDLDK
jgi:hypothetical protein